MESVIQLAFYFVFESIADKFDYVDDENENVSFLHASYKYIIFIITNILAIIMVAFFQRAFISICALFMNLKPYYARIFVEMVYLLLQPFLLSDVRAFLDSNLSLIRLAHFVSCLIKITIYTDVFNNFLFHKYVSTEEVAQEHRLAKKLSTREISIRIGLFSFYSLFTYYFHFFPFKWLPIDFLVILSYDVFTDENFKQKTREYNYQLNQERMNETFLKQIKRTPLTINECLTYIAGIKFIFFSFQYLRNYFDCDKEVSTLIFDYEICDRTYWLTNGNAEHGSLQICVNFVFKNYKIFSEKCSDGF